MVKKRKKRRKIKNWVIVLIILILVGIEAFLLLNYSNKSKGSIKISKIYINDEKIVVEISKDAKCSLNNTKNWVKSKNKKCTFDFTEKVTKIYIKTEDGKVEKHNADEEFGIINSIKVPESIYLIQGETEKIEYTVDKKGKVDDKPKFTSSNTDIITVEGETINAVGSGETTVKVSLGNIEKEIKIYSTNMLTLKTANFNYDKPYLSCGLFSEADNDLLDNVLQYKMDKVGYKTRAAVVEAGRFITLNFPYRINYFSENGRMADWPKADGEGRYYHKGLYLHESRFSNLNKDYIMNGPNPWGCPIYSNPAGGTRLNGLDCSGFISWIIVQGGFDPTDMGAGVDSDKYDFTDIGPKQTIPKALDKGELKVGDLLSGDGETSGAVGGGHIAMLIGVHDGYYYVAEELWGNPSPSHGAVAQRYTESEFRYYFYWHIDMSEFYGKDGNLTDYWL